MMFVKLTLETKDCCSRRNPHNSSQYSLDQRDKTQKRPNRKTKTLADLNLNPCRSNSDRLDQGPRVKGPKERGVTIRRNQRKAKHKNAPRLAMTSADSLWASFHEQLPSFPQPSTCCGMRAGCHNSSVSIPVAKSLKSSSSSFALSSPSNPCFSSPSNFLQNAR
jgi:hypothetical protein